MMPAGMLNVASNNYNLFSRCETSNFGYHCCLAFSLESAFSVIKMIRILRLREGAIQSFATIRVFELASFLLITHSTSI